MKLNDLESEFFDNILNAELGVPVYATLEYDKERFDIIVVPEVTGEGYFRLNYYNAPAYNPGTQNSESAVPYKSFSMNEILGTHPSLERASLNGDQVTVTLYPSRLPSKPESPPKLDATVLYAGRLHRGALGLDKNQVTAQKTPLKKAEFSIVQFPDFVAPEHRIALYSGDGWQIVLTRDDKHTRDMVSHTGVIDKSDGSEYGTGNLGDVMEGLKYFFAFAAGVYCHHTVAVGYDSGNRPVWGEIGEFNPARPRPNWFSSVVPVGTDLEKLSPGFWRRWGKNKNEINAVIECYVHSNAMRQAGITKDAVAKSYAGLEILASLVLGQTIRQDSAKRINEVLSKNRIPHLRLDQSNTPVLAKLCNDLNVGNYSGPHLLSNVRNYVPHPLDPKTPAEVKAKHLRYLDADPVNYVYLHDLCQYSLEYAFLKFCGFQPAGYRPLLETRHQV